MIDMRDDEIIAVLTAGGLGGNYVLWGLHADGGLRYDPFQPILGEWLDEGRAPEVAEWLTIADDGERGFLVVLAQEHVLHDAEITVRLHRVESDGRHVGSSVGLYVMDLYGPSEAPVQIEGVYAQPTGDGGVWVWAYGTEPTRGSMQLFQHIDGADEPLFRYRSFYCSTTGDYFATGGSYRRGEEPPTRPLDPLGRPIDPMSGELL